MAAEFSVVNLITSYGSFRISNVSIHLRSGDIFGLVGRSGSGKSTLIKAFVGLKRQDSGDVRILIDGKTADLSSSVGYSPQENSIYQFLTLEENLFTFGELYGINKKELGPRVDDMLKRLDLSMSRKKRVSELSGGMQKRADLAVALLPLPAVIVLDEPFNGLDVSLQNFIWDLLKELASQGKIIIISSHLISDIQKNCNQFGLVENGTFYNTIQIMETIKAGKIKSLEYYLENLFTKDLKSGR